MRLLVSVLAVLTIGTLSQTFAADAKKAAPAPETKAATAKPVAPEDIVIETNEPAVDPNAVVLTIGDTKVTEGRLAKILAPRLKQMAGRVPPAMMGPYKQQMRKQAMEQTIIEAMLTEKEKAANITVSEEEVTTQINKQIAQQNLTLDDFKSLLKSYNVDYSEYQDNMKKRAMFEKLMEAQFVGKIKEPNDADIKAYYDQNAQQFTTPESIHVKHILIRPADGNDPNKAKLEAKAKAQELLAKVKGGAEFETVAKENSACPSAKEGGDLGVQPKGTFVPEFEKAANALKPGEISDIVETQFGYHIIKLVERLDANTTSLENAKGKITAALGDKQKEKIVMDYIQNLKAEAKVNFTNEADKFDLNPPPKPAAVAPVRKSEPNTPQVKADANTPKTTSEAVKETSVKKVEKTVEKNVDKKADEKAKKKADKEAKKKAAQKK
ncbi:MAG: peptidylprolyl isomerase [Phycisphaerae bacterium]|jgi:peptidyl-prolyl cis-trans isomerase C